LPSDLQWPVRKKVAEFDILAAEVLRSLAAFRDDLLAVVV
jgi:hypothetical protein